MISELSWNKYCRFLYNLQHLQLNNFTHTTLPYSGVHTVCCRVMFYEITLFLWVSQLHFYVNLLYPPYLCMIYLGCASLHFDDFQWYLFKKQNTVRTALSDVIYLYRPVYILVVTIKYCEHLTFEECEFIIGSYVHSAKPQSFAISQNSELAWYFEKYTDNSPGTPLPSNSGW